MTTTAKLFVSGRSQAARLPAKLRLATQEVRIVQIGDALWIQAKVEPAADMGRWLKQFYASSEPLPSSFLADRQDTPPKERDWS